MPGTWHWCRSIPDFGGAFQASVTFGMYALCHAGTVYSSYGPRCLGESDQLAAFAA